MYSYTIYSNLNRRHLTPTAAFCQFLIFGKNGFEGIGVIKDAAFDKSPCTSPVQKNLGRPDRNEHTLCSLP